MYEYLKMLYKASRLEISDVYILHSYTPSPYTLHLHLHEQELTHIHTHKHTHAAAVARKLNELIKSKHSLSKTFEIPNAIRHFR